MLLWFLVALVAAAVGAMAWRRANQDTRRRGLLVAGIGALVLGVGFIVVNLLSRMDEDSIRRLALMIRGKTDTTLMQCEPAKGSRVSSANPVFSWKPVSDDPSQVIYTFDLLIETEARTPNDPLGEHIYLRTFVGSSELQHGLGPDGSCIGFTYDPAKNAMVPKPGEVSHAQLEPGKTYLWYVGAFTKNTRYLGHRAWFTKD